MVVARRTWLPLSMLAAGLAGLGLLAWELFTTSRELASKDGDVASPVGAARDASAAQRGDRGAREPAARFEAARDRADDPILFAPGPELLRTLEQVGRACFWGVVLDPSGAPCADATIFAGGREQATSDARGVWRIEVDHDVAIAWGGQSYAKLERPVLAARKEGVGVACVDLDGRSRRIDLALARGQRLRGACLDRATRRPVAHAKLQFLFEPDLQRKPMVGLALAATADADGRFALDALPAGAFDLRAEAEGRDSCGYEPFEFPSDGGRTREVTLLLDDTLTIKGFFAPWPLPGGLDDSLGPSGPPPRVVVDVDEPHDRGLDEREFGGEVAADGTFAFQVPSSSTFVATLVAGTTTPWTRTVEAEYGPRDVDFGRVELAMEARARVRGRVLLSPELLELGVVAQADRSSNGRNHAYEQPVGTDGSFAFATLPPGYLSFYFQIADRHVGSFRSADGDESTLLLAAGEELELPPFTPWTWGRRVCGRVTDEDGVPVLGATVATFWQTTQGRWSRGELVDHDGRFVLEVPDERHLDDDGYPTGAEEAVKLQVEVRARGFAPQRFTVDLAPEPRLTRHDFRLARTDPLHGRLVDGQGGALAGWRVRLSDDGGDRDDRNIEMWQVTDARGEFTIFGAPATQLRVLVDSPAFEVFEPAPIDATARAVVLTVRGGK